MRKRVHFKPPKFDPSRNTHGLVKATAQYQNGMRRELDKRLTLHADYIHRLKTQEFSMQDAARQAESKRLDEQLRLRDTHDHRLADMINSRSDAAIHIASQRLDRLEKFMYEQSGKGAGLSQSWGILIALAGVAIAGAALYFK